MLGSMSCCHVSYDAGHSQPPEMYLLPKRMKGTRTRGSKARTRGSVLTREDIHV